MRNDLETELLFAARILKENVRRDPLLLSRSLRSEDPSSLDSLEARFSIKSKVEVHMPSSQDLVSHAAVRIRADMLFGIKVVGESGIDLARLVECSYLFD